MCAVFQRCFVKHKAQVSMVSEETSDRAVANKTPTLSWMGFCFLIALLILHISSPVVENGNGLGEVLDGLGMGLAGFAVDF